MRKVEVNWIKDRQFEAVNQEGARFEMDIPKAKGGSGAGPTPIEASQAAIGTCSAMDIVNILTKMRQEVKSLQVVTETTQAPEHPMYFTLLKLTFLIEGENLDRTRVEKAVDLSMNKYCSLTASLHDKCRVETEIIIK